MGEAARTSQRIVCLELGSLESIRHERMHARGARNVVGKARYRRESPEGTSRGLRPVDRKLRRTSLRDRRSDTIRAVLSALIRFELEECEMRRLGF